MKILGISGSPRKEDVSGVFKLVKTVLENTDCDYELVSLRGKTISGCIACLGCVQDNVCKVDDDMAKLRDKIVEADAYVIGSPNYYSTLNVKTHAFMERLFQFRHQEGNILWGKLAVAVGVGGTKGQPVTDNLEKFFSYNFIETVAKISGQGAASCYSCGYGDTCKVGIPNMLNVKWVDKKPESVPDVSRQPEVMQSAVDAGKLLSQRLQGHNRTETAQKMQQKMFEMLQSSV
jgi:multimeric flavodoxin WrbA